MIAQQQKENQAWYDRKYNEDPTKRADTVRLLTQMQEQIKLLSETQGDLLKKLGAPIEDSSQPQRNESQAPERANESPATV